MEGLNTVYKGDCQATATSVVFNLQVLRAKEVCNEDQTGGSGMLPGIGLLETIEVKYDDAIKNGNAGT